MATLLAWNSIVYSKRAFCCAIVLRLHPYLNSVRSEKCSEVIIAIDIIIRYVYCLSSSVAIYSYIDTYLWQYGGGIVRGQFFVMVIGKK